VIIKYGDYIDELHKALDRKPLSVFISTFNLQTGVSGRGTVYQHSDTYKLMSRVNNEVKNSFVLVGLPSHNPPETEAKVQCCSEEWKNIRFRTRGNMHLKCWIFSYDKHMSALAGGRNLGDSQWDDVSWWLNQSESKQLKQYLIELYGNARPIKPRKVDALSIQLPNGRLI
jgi:hypothetical protein